MKTEGVYNQGVWFLLCEVMCKALCALEKREDVVVLAKKAAALSKVYTGKDGGWSRVAEAPEKTAWWGRRKKLTK
ncbi:hypothetical protein DXG03_001545 [Asterophora parasitica]|uniref:Uncharacterized protein n=1 Tax=Asterophora parasitica TaxID=117018 RepID=A0A9P7G3D5_9AGAR|nr:hypothetical protein DXG03_001545 [Asterophora parasitica]